MSKFIREYNRYDYIKYLSNNGDPFPRSTTTVVTEAGGEWIVDGAHSLSRYVNGTYQVQQEQNDCDYCGEKITRGISGEWTDTSGSAQCEPQVMHRVAGEDIL